MDVFEKLLAVCLCLSYIHLLIKQKKGGHYYHYGHNEIFYPFCVDVLVAGIVYRIELERNGVLHLRLQSTNGNDNTGEHSPAKHRKAQNLN